MVQVRGEIVIVAPHPDDEIIGCFEILKEPKTITIIYPHSTESKRREEAQKLSKELSNVKLQLYLKSIPEAYLNKEITYYFPDPVYEVHPEHRQWGAIGESLARVGFDVIFYSTLMDAPYIHECSDPKEKEKLLNKIYPSQKDLWRFDKRYILFEGRNKWIF